MNETTKNNASRFVSDEAGKLVFKPSREWILSLKVGSLAPDCFNRIREVRSIFARGEDQKGRAFVCVELAWGETSTMSDSYKQDELHRGLGLTRFLDSAQCDGLEAILPSSSFYPCKV